MTESPTTREAVALFADRAAFDRAVESLRAAGFERTDLSVLASHESLDAAGRPPQGYDETLLGLVGEMKYAFPLTTAGLIALVGGPVTATIAALVTAGIGGIAAKDYLDQVTATPHTEDFARALESGGVILWVSVPEDGARDAETLDMLRAAGGRNAHIVDRPVPTEA